MDVVVATITSAGCVPLAETVEVYSLLSPVVTVTVVGSCDVVMLSLFVVVGDATSVVVGVSSEVVAEEDVLDASVDVASVEVGPSNVVLVVLIPLSVEVVTDEVVEASVLIGVGIIVALLDIVDDIDVML